MASFGTDASLIRDLLRDRGHTKWGFVVYRCTYEDETAWERFKQILNQRALDTLAKDDALDLAISLDWNIQDNRATLDGASKKDIRARFRTWLASDAAKAEQPNQVPVPTMLGLSPRYDVCIHVDAEALDSVLRVAPQPPALDLYGAGYVNMIDVNWEMEDPATYNYEENGLDPEIDDPNDDGEEEVEGCKMMEVGWMKVCLDGLVPSAYAFLQNPGGYYIAYKRPPEIWVR